MSTGDITKGVQSGAASAADINAENIIVFPLPHFAQSRQLRKVAARVKRWSELAAKAHPPNTLAAWAQDWTAFMAYCRREDVSPLPATPQTLEGFIADRIGAGKALASLRRYRSTISKAHAVAGFADPGKAETVRLALKAAANVRPARQRQARGLIWEDAARFLAQPILSMRDHRDRAFVAVAYDTMCRSAELVRFDVEDFDMPDSGPGLALVRRTKTDQSGEGAHAFLAPTTVELLRTWLKVAAIENGAVFRRVVGRHSLGERLRPAAASGVLKRVVLRSGVSIEAYCATSGHSTRVGAIQDLLALNAELPAIQRDARLKDPRMVVRYGERVLASRGAMARAAKAQGRA